MDMFTKFNVHLEEEQEVREKIREIVRRIDTESKEAVTVLQVIHSSLTDVMAACFKAREIFQKCNGLYQELSKVVPSGQYYRFSDHWNWTTQRLVSLIALVIYLEKGILVTRDTCAEILGLESDTFFLDLEMYLIGILQMSNDLSRFAINSVTLGDYSRVLMLQTFISDLSSGFRLLNLKNDTLRKKFDGLKYDVKKIEEIVYDLSIRGLLVKPGVMDTSNNAPMKED